MTLLLVFVSLDPELASFLLVGNHFVKTLDTVVQLGLGELEGLLNAHLLSLKSRLHVDELVYALV